MKAIELIDKFLSNDKFVKVEVNVDFPLLISYIVSLTYKQGQFLNSLLSQENLKYSSAQGFYKKSGMRISFNINSTPYTLDSPAQWYGDKGFWILTKVVQKR